MENAKSKLRKKTFTIVEQACHENHHMDQKAVVKFELFIKWT
jgi:hypothetical protein